MLPLTSLSPSIFIMNDLINLINERFLLYKESYLPGSKSFMQIEKLRLIFLSYIASSENSIKAFYLAETHEARTYKKKHEGYQAKLIIFRSGNVLIEIEHTQQYHIKDKIIPKLLNFEFGYIYFVKSQYGYKIGKAKDLNKRLRTFDVKLPFETECKYYFRTHNMRLSEMATHDYFVDYRLNGEWFNITSQQIGEYCRDNGIKLSEYVTGHIKPINL